ncbi:tyrosine-type recombinase/integrase [Aurantiacibacter odishensis]|uniref:tyrosine-type recombinase/integrase n=1 Tax=Aurantiacibacter odishensis TaxID=1155476 RepID=UPI000E73BB1B|nr:site-specific integrase [Aurantiacibacter odishensis]
MRATGELRTMRWADVNLDDACWIIPAEQMKVRREHRVPLSRQALETIRSMQDTAAYSEYVFPSDNSKKPPSENAINGALRRPGYGGRMIAHSYGSTASSLLNESGKRNADAIERALAHQDSNPSAQSTTARHIADGRVAMMQWWSDEIDAMMAEASITR